MSTPPTSALIRTIPSAWDLSCSLLTLAVVVKLTRKDGLVLGFTSHDADLLIGGVLYEALSSVQASNLRQELGRGAENLEMMGLLQSERITDTDLLAGLYDSARLQVGIVDWSNPAAGIVRLSSGFLGQVTVEEGAYRVEFRSLMQRFDQQIGILTSPTCRVKQLGDSQCKVNLAGNTADGHPITSAATIASVLDLFTLTFSGGVNINGFYSNGEITFTSGLNKGLSREINSHGNGNGLDTGGPVASSPGSFGTLGFSNNFGQITNAFTFTIPAGTWSSGFVTVNSTWTAHSSTLGTDELDIYVPTTQESLVRQSAVPGIYSDVLTLGNAALDAVNGAVGGTLNCGFQHSSPGSGGYFNIAINSCTLTLEGVIAGTSNRIVLQEEFPFPISAGDSVILVAGCDRLYNTCKRKFANLINRRAEDFMPGIDKLIQIGRHN